MIPVSETNDIIPVITRYGISTYAYIIPLGEYRKNT
jgi:hypothetical protein